MLLVEQIQVKNNSSAYAELDHACFLSKNLYNAALYSIRQHFFKTKSYKGYGELNKEMVQTKNPDYYALNANTSQQILKLVDQNFKSFFGSIKKKIKTHIPRYLPKNGRQEVIFTNQRISKKELKKGFLKMTGIKTEFKLRDEIKNIQQARIIPQPTFGCYMVEIVYKVEEKEFLQDNGRYASIDIGVNNLATVSFNFRKPFIVNGRPLKSINQYYNKKKANFKEKVKTRKAQTLNRKRRNKIRDYLHKASRHVVNQLVSESVSTLFIGKNDGWKQEASMRRRGNQNFVSIPFYNFISMLEYKCRLEGIRVFEVQESYTSKCSFLDNEEIKKHDSYMGRRIKRGLFKSRNGRFINADVNGSLNIMRKVVGERASLPDYSIEVCSTPKVVSF
ncbi:MAG: transposase [Clostridia bacterium]|nr:transposase [Clostridia bacterium]